MKNIKLIGLSALAGALAMTTAHAGSVSMTGSMEVTYTKGSGYQDTGNPLGQENELSVIASTELDNGVTVAYKQSITADNARNDSELVFGNILGGTLAMTSTGNPISAIDDVHQPRLKKRTHKLVQLLTLMVVMVLLVFDIH